MTDLAHQMLLLGEQAKTAADAVRSVPAEQRSAGIAAMARHIRAATPAILAANATDVAAATRLVDRLRLDEARIEAMAASLDIIASLPDVVGQEMARWTPKNGLDIARIRTPIGVIGMIYESRPNVTADAGALCLKAGNAVILRGGSESSRSSAAIHECLSAGLDAAGLPRTSIQLVPTADRTAVGHMLADMVESIDLIVPRGGKSLIARVRREARVPVMGHLEGVCHVYVDRGADLEMAKHIVLNAKMRRTGICGSAETLLVDRAGASTHLAPLIDALLGAGCEVRGDEASVRADARVKTATQQDWYAEYLDAIIAVRVVEGVDAAIEHIRRYGSKHTDCIVTDDTIAAERFLARVDSAIVLLNASTQFADGGEFGMGAEIGISTDKFHARGPVGVAQLTSYKYVVRGSGQIRG